MQEYTCVPEELKKLPQWVARREKIPYTPHTGTPAKAGVLETWGTFEDAVKAQLIRGYDGIGFEFAEGGGIVGIDLDHCIDPQKGIIADWANKIIDRMDSYTEVSPSGSGVHIFVRGDIPVNGRKKVIDKATGAAVEMYKAKRYFTVTGAAIKSAPISDRTEELKALYAELFPERQKQQTAPQNTPEYLQIGLERDKTLQALWNGERRTEDESGNDLALFNKLAYWCNRDEQQMINAFLSSPHASQKDGAHTKKIGREDYLHRTAQAAIGSCNRTAAEDNAGAKTEPCARSENTLPGNVPEKKKVSSCKLITLDSVQAKKSDWLWYPYIPLGKITLLSADPGTGKTFFCLYLAAKTSTGGVFFGDTTERPPANVLYQTAEDGIEDTIKPRLIPMNPDFSRIGLIDEREQGLNLSDSRIENTMQEFKPKLMIFDPLQAYLGAEVDMHRANEVRPILAQISRLAEEYKCAIILVMHMSKMSQSKALYRGLGSIDIPAVARSMLIMGKHPENADRRILCHEKSSLAMHGDSIEFSISPENGGVVFHGFSSFTADDILNVKKGERDKPSVTLNEAVAVLGEFMGDEQAAKLDEIKELQKKYGFSQPTLYRAKDELGLKTAQIGFYPKTTWWLAPDIDVEEFKRTHTEGQQTGL